MRKRTGGRGAGRATTLLAIALLLASCASTAGRPPVKAAPPSDSGITAQIRAKIASDPALHTLKVSVTTADGEVVLSGTVSEKRLKVRLIRLALRVEGVKSVKDEIRVMRK